jgi:hypothetical protein
MSLTIIPGNVIGVLQAINKDNEGIFTQSDEVVIENFMQLVGITLRNVEVYKDAIANYKRAQGMLAMLNSLPANLGERECLENVIGEKSDHTENIILSRYIIFAIGNFESPLEVPSYLRF